MHPPTIQRPTVLPLIPYIKIARRFGPDASRRRAPGYGETEMTDGRADTGLIWNSNQINAVNVIKRSYPATRPLMRCNRAMKRWRRLQMARVSIIISIPTAGAHLSPGPYFPLYEDNGGGSSCGRERPPAPSLTFPRSFFIAISTSTWLLFRWRCNGNRPKQRKLALIATFRTSLLTRKQHNIPSKVFLH